MIKAARRAVDRPRQSGFRYSKAGIITQDLVPPAIRQRALFDNLDHERAAKVTELWGLLDTPAAREIYGRNRPGSHQNRVDTPS